MRKTFLFTLLLLPAAAFAQDRCRHSQPRTLQLELDGVKIVVFDVGPHALRIDAGKASSGSLDGRACASGENRLEELTLTQQRVGDKLVVQLRRNGRTSGIFIGNTYARLEISGTIPAHLPVQLKVGSGDAVVSGAASLSADVGSGDVQARRIRGPFVVAVGSGDIEASQVGSLQVVSIGSGDVQVRQVGGTSKIGSIGSGDLKLEATRQGVQIGSLGSGDVELRNIGGDVVVGSIGSGDVDVDDVRGNLLVRSVGSGSARHNDVSGRIDLPKRR